MPEVGVVKTGIKGLDSILLGGIPRNNVILVQGVTGSGKTLLGLEFIYRGIVEYDEPGIIVVFETSKETPQDSDGIWRICANGISFKSSLPALRYSIRNCVRRTACCSKLRARWAPNESS
jgi:hypothetical protein